MKSFSIFKKKTSAALLAAAALCLAAGAEAAVHTVTVADTAGIGSAGSGEYEAGTRVTVTAGKAGGGRKFKKWASANPGLAFWRYSAVTTFTMPDTDVTITAEYGLSFTDERDGKEYGMEKIGTGNKIWMTENLNYDTLNAISTRCISGKPDSCSKYGRLYDWTAAMNVHKDYEDNLKGGSYKKQRGICPAEWHLPDTSEWNYLMNIAGAYSDAGRKLRAESGWSPDTMNGTDELGFTVFAADYALPLTPPWFTINTSRTYFWAAEEYDLSEAYSLDIWLRDTAISAFGGVEWRTKGPGIRKNFRNKGFQLSVRCVADRLAAVKPEAATPLHVYTGEELSAGIAEDEAYTIISGTGINAGDYVARVVLNDGYIWWPERTTDELELPWRIVKAPGKFMVLDTLFVIYSDNLNLSHIELPEGYTWAASVNLNTKLTPGAHTFAAVYVENGNYEPDNGLITLMVLPGDGTFMVKFSAGAGGTLRATVDGVPIASGGSVGGGKSIVFIAVPNAGYSVTGWNVNGTDIVDTVSTYVLSGLSEATAVTVAFGGAFNSAASSAREIPNNVSTGEAAIAPPVIERVRNIGEVSIGPNPVKSGGTVAIYWNGGKAVSGRLGVYNALGARVALVSVKGVGKIGEWKAGGAAEGTYLIKGALKDKSGVRVPVSLLVDVARLSVND